MNQKKLDKLKDMKYTLMPFPMINDVNGKWWVFGKYFSENNRW